MFFEACIEVALSAAEHGAPIQKQKNVERWVKVAIEKKAGKIATDKEIKDQLATAQSVGRLRYVPGHGKAAAGYYPMETDPEVLRTSGIDTAKEEKQRAEAF